ncbi:MAG: hypothetical protein COC15_04500 [Legionellales bacterium]|nr:MAG: hypothetical protein COC15_04500 [Legionellales bacterium]
MRNLAIIMWFSVAIFASSVSITAKAIETRQITPPKLESAHIGKRILCNRPMRRGTPAMFVEHNKVLNKIIAHNYGHGGSGWTLAPGAAKHVVRELDDILRAEKISKQEPITIIGAGILGLLNALELHNFGYKNITIVAESFDNLTSHNAAGLLAPVSMDNNPKMQKLINKIGVDAYKFYKRIALGKNPQIKTGARIVPAYFNNREESGLEPYVGVVMQPAKDVLLDFGTGVKRPMIVYDDGIFMDTQTLLVSLTRTVKNYGIKLQRKMIHSFADIETKVIVNCAGYGAKKLAQDKNLLQVQGHLVMLKDQNPQDINHMILIYLDSGKTTDGAKIKRSFYMFPKSLAGAAARDVGVLGGTFIEGATTANIEEFDILIANAKKFYGI